MVPQYRWMAITIQIASTTPNGTHRSDLDDVNVLHGDQHVLK
jgi:hypothetical protein